MRRMKRMKRRQFATFLLLIPEKSSRGKMMKNEEEEEEGKSSLRGRRFGSLEVHHSHNIFPNSPFFSLFKLYVVESRYNRQKKTWQTVLSQPRLPFLFVHH